MAQLRTMAFLVISWIVLVMGYHRFLTALNQAASALTPENLRHSWPVLQQWLIDHPVSPIHLQPGTQTAFDPRHHIIFIRPVPIITWQHVLEFLHEWAHARQPSAKQSRILFLRIPLALFLCLAFFCLSTASFILSSLVSLIWIGAYMALEIRADTIAFQILRQLPNVPPAFLSSRLIWQRKILHASNALLLSIVPYALAGYGLAVFTHQWAQTLLRF